MLDLSTYRKFKWEDTPNVQKPEVFTDDFSADNGYFNEENGAKNWRIENGVMTCTAGDEPCLTFMHVYEANVSFTARVRFPEKPQGSCYGLVLRYNSDTSYVRAHFNAAGSNWSIATRDCADTIPVGHTCFTGKMKQEEGRWYDVNLTVIDGTAVVSVDGNEITRLSDIDNYSHGKIGIYAKNITLEVDSVKVELLSGNGTVWKNCVHNLLPDNKYREGGSVTELSDGTLMYEHHAGDSFKSTDNGCTWERCDTWIEPSGYMNVLRLRDGDLIRIYRKWVEDRSYQNIITMTSSDDGKTWVEGGVVSKSYFGEHKHTSGWNMNDKITEASNGRIFYCQNFEVGKGPAVDGRLVFCEFLYSDDKGKTWNKCETHSWTIPGNEGLEKFGECKILECDDGTLRMYNSWNDNGCVVYSESRDGGITWGALTEIPELKCARSSMQFCRDAYADNETTYYMVWVYDIQLGPKANAPRSRLSMARSYNGKDWHFLGDVCRFECQYMNSHFIAHILDPFIMTTKDHVVVGYGLSEQVASESVAGNWFHNAQRQHICSVKKDSLCDIELKAARGGKIV